MRRTFASTWLLLALGSVVLLAACDSPAEPDDVWARPEQVTFAPSLKVELASMNRTSSGLYWKDLAPGEGDTAKVGEKDVRVSYSTWLPDGTLVYATPPDSGAVVPLLGYGFMIKGFDEGIVGMRIGGVRQLVVRPELAFGRMGSPDDGIPPLTTLVFEVKRLTTIAK